MRASGDMAVALAQYKMRTKTARGSGSRTGAEQQRGGRGSGAGGRGGKTNGSLAERFGKGRRTTSGKLFDSKVLESWSSAVQSSDAAREGGVDLARFRGQVMSSQRRAMITAFATSRQESLLTKMVDPKIAIRVQGDAIGLAAEGTGAAHEDALKTWRRRLKHVRDDSRADDENGHFC